MTTAAELVEALRKRGIEVTASGEQVRLRAPRGMVAKTIMMGVKQLKPSILIFLDMEATLGGACLSCRERQPLRGPLCWNCWYSVTLYAGASLQSATTVCPPGPAPETDLRLDRGDVVEPAAYRGAVLLRSKIFGEFWVVNDPSVTVSLAAEETLREEPRPMLHAGGIARLRGQPEGAIRALLEMARVVR